MKKYITKFSTTSEYEAAYGGGQLDFPNVSLTEDNKEIRYRNFYVWKDNEIIYYADNKLPETTSNKNDGIRINTFWYRNENGGITNPINIQSHVFENGKGTIITKQIPVNISYELFSNINNIYIDVFCVSKYIENLYGSVNLSDINKAGTVSGYSDGYDFPGLSNIPINKFYIDKKNTRYKLINNCIIDVDKNTLIKGIPMKIVNNIAIIRVPDNIVAISAGAFNSINKNNYTNVEKFIYYIPSSVKIIGKNAFIKIKNNDDIIIFNSDLTPFVGICNTEYSGNLDAFYKGYVMDDGFRGDFYVPDNNDNYSYVLNGGNNTAGIGFNNKIHWHSNWNISDISIENLQKYNF